MPSASALTSQERRWFRSVIRRFIGRASLCFAAVWLSVIGWSIVSHAPVQVNGHMTSSTSEKLPFFLIGLLPTAIGLFFTFASESQLRRYNFDMSRDRFWRFVRRQLRRRRKTRPST